MQYAMKIQRTAPYVRKHYLMNANGSENDCGKKTVIIPVKHRTKVVFRIGFVVALLA
jgi:hypothetical protein